MLSIIATLLGFIMPLLADWLQTKRKSGYAEDKHKFDLYLAGADAVHISAMFEQLHRPENISNPSGQNSNKTP